MKIKTSIKNETGNVYGRLIVLAYDGRDSHGKPVWLCRCECGKEVVVCGHELRNGNTKSCGCLHKQIMSAMSGKNSPTWKGGRKKNHCGYILAKADNHPRSDARGYVLEHILVAERVLGEYLPAGSVIHHINGIKHDNRIENLWWFSSNSEHTKHHAKLRKQIKEVSPFYPHPSNGGGKGRGIK
jgi:hypothetical protein